MLDCLLHLTHWHRLMTDGHPSIWVMLAALRDVKCQPDEGLKSLPIGQQMKYN
jgi:hypothetical protein